MTRETSLGFEVADFADQVLGMPLLPWQRWLFVHALETDRDGAFRFRTVLVLVARQNGKTAALVVLSLWRLFVDAARLVLGTAQDLSIASEAWQEACQLAEAVPELDAEIENAYRANGKEHLRLNSGARYLVKASTRKSTRGLSADLLLMDELREQHGWEGWAAASKTTNARHRGQRWATSNAGDERSVVLNHLREAALSGRDKTIGLFEWSAPDSCELDDRDAWAQANPGLGHIISEDTIASNLTQDPPEVFRTEILCQKVDAIDTAISPAAWEACADPAGTMEGLRDRVALCLDVAPDGEHVTLAAAAVNDEGRVRVEVVDAWKNTEHARTELPELIERIEPKQVAWFPSGPAAALGPEMRALDARTLKGGEVNEACQGFADLIAARRVLHSGGRLLSAHVAGARKLHRGDGWKFVRRGAGHVDAAYAAAGAVHVARTLPEDEESTPMIAYS